MTALSQVTYASDPDEPVFEGWSRSRREYAAYGPPFHDSAHAMTSLGVHGDPAAVDRAGAFAFHAPHRLTGAFGNPKPVRRPHPPVLVGGRSAPNAAGVAEHADLWNMPGGEIDDVVRRSAQRDRHCAGIGRDPRSHWPSPFWRGPPGRSR